MLTHVWHLQSTKADFITFLDVETERNDPWSIQNFIARKW